MLHARGPKQHRHRKPNPLHVPGQLNKASPPTAFAHSSSLRTVQLTCVYRMAGRPSTMRLMASLAAGSQPNTLGHPALSPIAAPGAASLLEYSARTDAIPETRPPPPTGTKTSSWQLGRDARISIATVPCPPATAVTAEGEDGIAIGEEGTDKVKATASRDLM